MWHCPCIMFPCACGCATVMWQSTVIVITGQNSLSKISRVVWIYGASSVALLDQAVVRFERMSHFCLCQPRSAAPSVMSLFDFYIIHLDWLGLGDWEKMRGRKSIACDRANFLFPTHCLSVHLVTKVVNRQTDRQTHGDNPLVDLVSETELQILR